MSDTCKGKVCPKLSGPVFSPKQGIIMHEVVCIEHRCAHYQHLLGNNPQSGVALDQWDCAFNWVNILSIENAQQTRQAGAAIESFRNEMVRMNAEAARFLLASSKQLPGQQLLAGGGEVDLTKDLYVSRG